MPTFARSDLGTLKVRDIMVHRPAVIGFWTPLRAAATRLEHGPADAAIVLQDEGRLVGLLGEHELVFGALAELEGLPGHAGHYAEPRFVFAREEETVETLLWRLAHHDVRRAIVVDEAQRPAGLVSLWMDMSVAGRDSERKASMGGLVHGELESASEAAS